MFKVRSLLFWRGLDIVVMGIELMVKGLVSPTWAFKSGFSIKPDSEPGNYTIIYSSVIAPAESDDD